ncbi:hypothetical protein HDU87_008523 [Geranomyces variabilis]|uniref:RRM domain-containing protein n=1 Tax=Geranomyces variabilis TaxID=109894 RepID=A0AAD5XPY7_9FUNG|nr:hypothetical protein HDU87_008523 [Geranomyces variabilis]
MATDTEVKKEPVTAVKVEPINSDGAVDASSSSHAEGGAAAPKRVRKRNNRRKPKAAAGANGGDDAGIKSEDSGSGGAAAAAIEHDNTAKVFVGNLSFETTKQQISEIFGKAGKIADVNIITRGERSLGYGFISFENDADADRAVEMLDKTEIAERQINVERAQDKESKAARGRVPRGRGGATAGRGRGGRGYSRGGAVAGRDDGAARVDGDDDVHAENEGDDGAHRGRAGAHRGRVAKTPRAPRERTGETSTTTLFVANLPFKVTDEDLLNVFKGRGYNVSSAHVVKMRSGRSKGFGFVEVANQEEQQRILNEITTMTVEDRDLVIKVAMANQTGIKQEPDADAANEQ